MSIPCVDPIIYPPVHWGDAVQYPQVAPDGRQWRPPAAPYMEVRAYRPGFDRACLECMTVRPNDEMVTGYLCRSCALKETSITRDPFGVAAFWLMFTTATESMNPIDEYQWYRWYGWVVTKRGKPVAPITTFHDLSAAWNSTADLGLLRTTSSDHVKHYIGRTFNKAQDECSDALAAGLIPHIKSTISLVDGIHD